MVFTELFVRSKSTWQQPFPAKNWAVRSTLLAQLARCISRTSGQRLRIGIDGRTGAGKTSFGHEIAQHLAQLGRPAFRACLDDFKKSWNDGHLYDRSTGEGYYRNAYDYQAVRSLLLNPLGPAGSGNCSLCSIDPITQTDYSKESIYIPPNGVLVVDGVFGFRPELVGLWEVRIWLEAEREEAFKRGTERDAGQGVTLRRVHDVHKSRYEAADDIYIQEVNPAVCADIVVDNTELAAPKLVRLCKRLG
ncbi:uridine kinase [Pleomorphomonas diazotrophica]|uniref:Uridine kinase n=1 Tax=Pleomorphomonas diazotrophica TaxID=1166257 RepID=A0A1I4SV69_9HYPH|nr:hypothetical protein [Pleomorphomonas diazotrophica]PKR88563.1 uridine kinase [Pleomorphomonas diazotrophica]SFM68428.1 uridine kinase [Pleomorphomonas diazotrophica]